MTALEKDKAETLQQATGELNEAIEFYRCDMPKAAQASIQVAVRLINYVKEKA